MKREPPESQRQKALARVLGVQFCDTPNLKPLHPHGGLWAPLLPATGLWIGQLTTETIAAIAFAAIAAKIRALKPNCHIIDHAWLAGYNVPPHEPWALVTEPYISEEDARHLPLLAHDEMPGWGIAIHVLTPAQSSWSPGNCTPIVATSSGAGYDRLFRKAIPWALGATEP